MLQTVTRDPPRRGRPREFDADDALEAALRTFVARGYAGASITDLTRAMGIARPSLYSCYGNKEALFKRALALHANKHLAYLRRLLDAKMIADVVQGLLLGAMAGAQRPGDVHGFLGLLTSLSTGIEDEGVRREVAMHQGRIIEVLAARFDQARSDGELPDTACPTTLAFFLEALAHGIAVQVRNDVPGEDRQELLRVSLRAFDLHAGIEAKSPCSAPKTTPCLVRAAAQPALTAA